MPTSQLDEDGLDRGLIEAIQQLPKPIGIYAAVDNQGNWLRDQLLQVGLRIPEDIAIIGTGDLQRACHSRMPFLSTVAMPWKMLGQEAARLIHFAIQAGHWPERNTLRPLRVIPRASTNPVLANDNLVADAVSWMKKHLSTNNVLGDLSAQLGVSANTLCRRFKSDLAVSPKQTLDRLRIERACELLQDDKLSIAEIATLCGFSGSHPPWCHLPPSSPLFAE